MTVEQIRNNLHKLPIQTFADDLSVSMVQELHLQQLQAYHEVQFSNNLAIGRTNVDHDAISAAIIATIETNNKWPHLHDPTMCYSTEKCEEATCG